MVRTEGGSIRTTGSSTSWHLAMMIFAVVSVFARVITAIRVFTSVITAEWTCFHGLLCAPSNKSAAMIQAKGSFPNNGVIATGIALASVLVAILFSLRKRNNTITTVWKLTSVGGTEFGSWCRDATVAGWITALVGGAEACVSTHRGHTFLVFTCVLGTQQRSFDDTISTTIGVRALVGLAKLFLRKRHFHTSLRQLTTVSFAKA